MSVATAVLAAAVALGAQAGSPVAAAPEFEIASIKRNTSDDSSMRVRTPPGQFIMVNGPVITLISFAYQRRDPQVIEVSDWVRTERYDVTARAVGTPSPERLPLMLRALLVDRFNLAAHTELRERPTYALMAARADGRLGPTMRVLDVDCEARQAAAARGNAPPPQDVPEGVPLCTMRSTAGTILAGGVSMSMFAQILAGRAGRIVVDKTGLAGNYAFTLTYAPEPTAAAGDAAPDDRASLFTALQEQLGLKLEAQRNPVEILVVDRIERPTED